MLDLKFGVDPDAAARLRPLLQGMLADLTVAAAKAQAYAWNVEAAPHGPSERLFREIAVDHRDAQDDAAERLRALGGCAEGRLSMLVAESELAECDGRLGEAEMLRALAEDQRRLSDAWRMLAAEALEEEDAATADLSHERASIHAKFAARLAPLKTAAAAA